MTDIRAEDCDESDRLPWLEAVEEDGASDGPSAMKLIAAVVIGLIAIGLVVGGLFWLGNRGGEGEGELIEAPDGAYKVTPEDPGGMQAEGEGGSAYAASEGAERPGNLNMNVAEGPAAPGQPQPQPGPQPKAGQPGQPQGYGQPRPQPQPQPNQPAQPQPNAYGRPAPPRPAPTPPGGGATIQLGAFSSPAAAETAWRSMAGRIRYLAPLGHSVTPVQAGGRTLYRLRASGPNAEEVCRRLRVAGEACTPVR